ncbi:MAG: DUF4301 family protein, partial [Acidobacteriota bacterium]
GRFMKFVPASGAASRMFKDLVAARRGDTDDAARTAARRFVTELGRLPLRAELAAELARRGEDLDAIAASVLDGDGDPAPILAAALDADGLDLANRPKALIPFHREVGGDADEIHNALEDHLIEAAEHLRARDGRCRVHFTIPQHQEMIFREQFREIASRLEPRYGAVFDISLSIQSPETDTIAATPEGEPFRDDEGRLVFRPGGHGALLTNLGRLDGDLVFVRNIDNVQPAHRRREVLRWNRLLGGYLVEVERALVDILRRVERSRGAGGGIEAEAREAAELLGRPDLLNVLDRPDRARRDLLVDLLDRPIRVAGVVPNLGEPGGGPFWVRDADGVATPQIVESAQIRKDDPGQAAIAAAATHFNPVHLVCRLRSHHGDAYDLDRFVDPSAVFLANKSHAGRPLRALERPGLWNGAMAHWHTVFVEVPAAIFAPVKTVFDLLRPEHQPA